MVRHNAAAALGCLIAHLVLSPGLAVGDDVRLNGPGGPVQVRDLVLVRVTGIADADLPAALVTATPADPVTMFPGSFWGGGSFILFTARAPGTYQLELKLNGWRHLLDSALTEAASAGVQPGDLADLAEVSASLAAAYPYGSATLEIVVHGDAPNPPRPPAEDLAVALVHQAEQNDRLTADQLQALYSVKVQTWARENGIPYQVIDPDPGGPDKERLAELDPYFSACSGAELPALVVIDAASGDALQVQPLPATEAALLDFLQNLKGG
jgi:hypothetical protein